MNHGVPGLRVKGDREVLVGRFGALVPLGRIGSRIQDLTEDLVIVDDWAGTRTTALQTDDDGHRLNAGELVLRVHPIQEH
jgi:hypothetical protein